MVVRRWTRDARVSLARLPTSLGVARVPDAPSVSLRDPWPGDTSRGSRLVKGELLFCGLATPLQPRQWGDGSLPPLMRAHLHGFTWLRDLRALGTDGGRMRARALVADWLSHPPPDPLARQPEVVAARLTAWLAHYDFFAASADDASGSA